MAEKKSKKNLMVGMAAAGGVFLALGILSRKRKAGRRLFSKADMSSAAAEKGIYEAYGKPCMDKAVAFTGLVLLSPLFLLISLAVYLDDPGPVFFTQKRVGKDKQFFCLHKFRTMKMETPHDMPTHQLEHPEQYITRVGRFLRKTSLDELPQIWDIFRGKMSIVGPRPALWNQDDLIAERDRYGANGIRPGLTGWAQINGRDELEIPDKAKLDGEYVKHLKQGGVKALFFDVRCAVGTVTSVLAEDGVVEGGTGELKKRESAAVSGMETGIEEPATVSRVDAGLEDYGHLKHFDIDLSKKNKKRVLITGAGSYIGESFEAYAKEHYRENFTVDTVDMLDPGWREKDFSSYDAVFHVAGIAHADVGRVDEETKRKYYAVNTDLAVETAKKARKEGVRQFVFMSSMIIYGDSAPYGKEKVIDETTVPSPANFYGDSKWQADRNVRKLASEDFHVAVLRPPMIYGKGSKGNYPILAKLARKLPVFPDVENRRSMLYINNLSEFLCKLMLSGEGGIYFPQNGEYTRTSEMVRQIAEAAGKRIWVTKLLMPAVVIGSHVPGKVSGLVDKAFGNAVYSQGLSRYEGLEYQGVSLEESITKTGCEEVAEAVPNIEKTGFEAQNRKKAVLILVNHDVVIYNFRLELVERLLADGYEVHISSPYGERIDDLIALGAIYHEISMNRHGMNPLEELSVLKRYKGLMKEVKPIIVFGYTIKPNIYGALAARQAHIPFVANITGLGTAVENGGVTQKLTVLLYKVAFTKIQRVFFQNEENLDFFRRRKIAIGKYGLLPGSGVNLERYAFSALPEAGNGISGEPVRFAFISRIMKEKGIDQYLEAAERIKEEYPATEFHICGFCEEEYEGRLDEMSKKGIVIYHGMIRDVAEFMSQMHCIVHPTYYPEGISNVLLEACATGCPIITTDRSGCREVVEDGVNGYMIPQRDSKALIDAIEQFISLESTAKQQMGLNGRRKVEQEFSREIIVSAYMDEIRKLNYSC